jgi:predicted Zn-dependent protease
MNYRRFSIAVLAATLLHSPSFVSSEVSGNDLPDFGDSSGSLISPAQEMELGEAFMNSIRAQATLIHGDQWLYPPVGRTAGHPQRRAKLSVHVFRG